MSHFLDFDIGDKVILVKEVPKSNWDETPIMGQAYTIGDMDSDGDDGHSILLQEIDCWYDVSYFELVEKNRESIRHCVSEIVKSLVGKREKNENEMDKRDDSSGGDQV